MKTERMGGDIFWQQRILALFSVSADLSQLLLLPLRQALEPRVAQMLFHLLLPCRE